MVKLTGGCFCELVRYEVELNSLDDARMSLCHCKNCKKVFGGNYGLTAKVPLSAFTLTKGNPKEHIGDNGSGSKVHREFCPNCGSYILEYGDAAKDDFRYIVSGSLDEPEKLPPKGEFFCRDRASWMPEIPGLFQKE
ncbi:DUF636 domain protein [Exidia glandulosa HHB12029]|uniref:DUF636 domain protein n=1 Tax=Exidia glandulosa HHB12029 TaxID=1314781 RepID=A0A165LIF8_EXIGL|nr:DUF636 domain protein [Exidia glandulosa HHB12029]